MGCKKPMVAYRLKNYKNPKTGKNIIIWSVNEATPETETIELPCGKCIGCMLERSRQTAIRCMLEKIDHDESYFLTLTYDEDHIRRNPCYDSETGEYYEVDTLYKKDYQDFMKRLREHQKRKYNKELRFYAVGEYGDTTGRAHYHALIYGLHIEDLELYKVNNGNPLYISEEIEKIWKNGQIQIGEVTFESAAYVGRYMMKKQKGDTKGVYEDMGIEPEFSLCSLKPGIGAKYFEQYKNKIYRYDSVTIPTAKGPITIKPPKYFDKLLDKEKPNLLEELKKKRLDIAIEEQNTKMKKTTLLRSEQLEAEELILKDKIKALQRTL